jgi:hypothetical protein
MSFEDQKADYRFYLFNNPDVFYRQKWLTDRAAADARRADRRTADAHRLKLYRNATRASFGCRVTQTLTLQVLQRHCVDLSLEGDPPIAICWMGPTSRSRALTSGVARVATRSICTPAIASHADYWTALHELGHLRRDPQARSRMRREISAWQWCLAHTKVWDDCARDFLRTSLRSYIVSSTDPFSIIEAERFIAAAARAPARAIPSHELAALERRIFEERFGPKRCEAGYCTDTYALAVTHIGSRFCCRHCAPLVQARLDIRRTHHRTSRGTSI